MATVHETDLLGKVFFETSPNTGTAIWTDHSATVSRMSLARGGSPIARGVSDVQAGSGTITLVDNDATIGIGYWVRVRTLSGNVWAGYVQDISTNFEWINGIKYSIKNLYCVDWVGYIGQILVPYITGLESNGSAITTMPYTATRRLNAMNYGIDATGATQMFTSVGSDSSAVLGHSNKAGSLAEHMDLLANTVGGYWNATTATPTNGTTGRDGLILIRPVGTTATASGVVFSDGTAPPGVGVGYQSIAIGQNSSSVCNTAVVRNTGQLAISSSAVAYDENLIYSHEYTASSTASVNAYGARQISVETNFGLSLSAGISANTQKMNRVLNPNFETDETGWRIGDFTSWRIAIRNPNLDPSPFASKSGEQAIRCRITAAVNNANINYTAENKDGIEVVAGQYYGVSFWGARSTTRSGRIYNQVRWFDSDNNLLSTSTGAVVDMTSTNFWFQARDRFLAPANAVKAQLRLNWERVTGQQWQIGDKLWLDKVCFWRMENAADWYENDGFNTITNTEINFSLGNVGSSMSVTCTNPLYSRATNIATNNAEPELVPQSLTWNAQTDLTKAHLIDLNKTVQTFLDSNYYIQRVLGIRHEITRSRWIVELELEPHHWLPAP